MLNIVVVFVVNFWNENFILELVKYKIILVYMLLLN